MTAALTTVNATVAQIEDALRAGRKVDDIVREFMEPRNNVIAIWQNLRQRGELNGHKTPATPTPVPRPLASAPNPPAGSALSVDALVAAASRSTSKRTKALGAKLDDLATVMRGRLAEEREAAERAEKVRAEQEAATAEVERLKAQLAAAQAKLRGNRGGVPGRGALAADRGCQGGSREVRRDVAVRVLRPGHHHAARSARVTRQALQGR